MKAAKEAMSPTRVKLTVEVPFDELKPSVDAAYRKLGRQVKVQGFRPGKVPPRILDQRIGRGTVLDEAVQDSLPQWYAAAAQETEITALGRPLVDIASFADGSPLVFTAEVDVRPEVDLPDYEHLPISVDDADVSEADVDTQIGVLRDRFATLEGVERPIEAGDFISMDLDATVNGQPVSGAQTAGVSYEVGSGSLFPGLDEALPGTPVGETVTVPTTLVGGEFAGQEAAVSVTVRSVKRKVLPDLDDDFATTASEFDTLAELRADVRSRLEGSNRLRQAAQARDLVLETLVERAGVPLPESVVAAEGETRMHNLRHSLDEAGMSLEEYLEREAKTREELDAELQTGAQKSVAAQLLLDAVANKEQQSVTDLELTSLLLSRAQRAGMAPEQYAQRLQEAGQLPALFAEVVRSKALALILEQAVVTDASGRPVELPSEAGPAAASDSPAETPPAGTPADDTPADDAPITAETFEG